MNSTLGFLGDRWVGEGELIALYHGQFWEKT